VTFFGCHLPTDTRVLPFYIVFSRDEVNTRLAQPLDFHFVDEGNEGVLCGLDSLTGTSWLAFDKQSKRVAFLTNFRSPNNAVMKAEKSRGRLVMNWVRNNLTVEEFSQSIFSEIEGYRGFNLGKDKIDLLSLALSDSSLKTHLCITFRTTLKKSDKRKSRLNWR